MTKFIFGVSWRALSTEQRLSRKDLHWKEFLTMSLVYDSLKSDCLWSLKFRSEEGFFFHPRIVQEWNLAALDVPWACSWWNMEQHWHMSSSSHKLQWALKRNEGHFIFPQHIYLQPVKTCSAQTVLIMLPNRTISHTHPREIRDLSTVLPVGQDMGLLKPIGEHASFQTQYRRETSWHPTEPQLLW